MVIFVDRDEANYYTIDGTKSIEWGPLTLDFDKLEVEVTDPSDPVTSIWALPDEFAYKTWDVDLAVIVGEDNDCEQWADALQQMPGLLDGDLRTAKDIREAEELEGSYDAIKQEARDVPLLQAPSEPRI
jgi:hypothetical protein